MAQLDLSLKKESRVYVSGPMTNLPEHNFPAFQKAAQDLRDSGFVAVSPHEINPEPGHYYSYYMRKDIEALLTCEAILMLPGWQYSAGANHELRQACIQAIPVFFAEGC